MLRTLIIFLSILWSVDNLLIPGASLIGDVSTVTDFAYDAIAVLKGELPLGALFTGSNGVAMDQLSEKMDDLSNQISEMSAGINDKLDDLLDQVLTKLPLQDEIKTAKRELHSYIVRIDELYENFKDYIRPGSKFNNYTLTNYLQAVISQNAGDLRNVLTRMYHLIVPGRSGSLTASLLSLLATEINQLPYEDRVDPKMTPQQRIFDIYNLVFVSEVRGFTMEVYAFALLSGLQNESYAAEGEQAVKHLAERAKGYVLEFRTAMRNIPRNFELMHPSSLQRDNTYCALDNIQIFVVPEPDIAQGASCSGICEDIDAPKVNACNDPDGWCQKRTCKGPLSYCESLASSKICVLPDDSSERYQFFSQNSGQTYGHADKKCAGVQKAATTWTWYLNSCDICMCACYEQNYDSTRIRMLSLRPQVSNVQENMIVVGARFTRRDKMIHIQIKEAKLGVNGRVDKSTGNWRTPEDLWTTSENSKTVVYKTEGGKKVYMEANKDYALISKDSRSLSLDDVTLPRDYIVTGIRWNIEKDQHQIEIQGTRFDFKSGTLDPSDSKWVTPQSMSDRSSRYNSNRDQLPLKNPDDPARSTKTLPDSEVNQFIKMRNTNAKLDAGQHTVPYFDSQELETPTGLGLNGIGIFHRGGQQSGGFFAFRTIDLDISQFLDASDFVGKKIN